MHTRTGIAKRRRYRREGCTLKANVLLTVATFYPWPRDCKIINPVRNSYGTFSSFVRFYTCWLTPSFFLKTFYSSYVGVRERSFNFH